jgi:hypothetical protein
MRLAVYATPTVLLLKYINGTPHLRRYLLGGLKPPDFLKNRGVNRQGTRRRRNSPTPCSTGGARRGLCAFPMRASAARRGGSRRPENQALFRRPPPGLRRMGKRRSGYQRPLGAGAVDSAAVLPCFSRYT